ncbi:MAG: SMP-30/gluconolactonase/LRE family protein, partial [Pseudomonadota bacterium]
MECVLDAKAHLGESAVWDAQEGALFWTDIDAGRVHRFDPATGEDTHIEVGEKAGCVALRRKGGAVLGAASGVYTLDLVTGEKTLVSPVEADLPYNRFNDGATDRQGRFWMGTYSMVKPQRPDAAFYRLDPDHTVSKWRG